MLVVYLFMDNTVYTVMEMSLDTKPKNFQIPVHCYDH